jgi:Zn-dependent protease
VLDPNRLACRNCGALAYRAALEQLSAEAMRLEPVDPAAAALRWRRCLEMLPPDSQQYAAIYQRLSALIAGFARPAYAPGGAYPAYAGQPTAYPGYPRYPAGGGPAAGPAAPPPEDTPLVAILKTGGSMLVSILVYAMLFSGGGSMLWGLLFATGFVVMILVHELGHVAAMRYYGLSASPPIFIPFLGAMIRLRQQPPDAKVEAVVGIGGPLAGTAGALACYALYLGLPDGTGLKQLVHVLALFGFFLNLFNLLPVPPLDGGRITAALSPRIWMLGIAALVGLIVKQTYDGHFPFILMLVLLFALPRVRATLAQRRAGGPLDPYYTISPTARWTIGALYVLLGIVLGWLTYANWGALDAVS